MNEPAKCPRCGKETPANAPEGLCPACLVEMNLDPGATSATDIRFVERFTREARTLARLNHPNIVAVYEFGERDGLFFLVLELVDGVSLRDLLREGKMPPKQALAIVPPICEALQYAHDKGVVHRDIKPENILVDKEGRVKVADFGIAKFAAPPEEEPHLTGDAERIGTAHYMAPEQVENPREVDHRADIYALGVVFYEMLTGELPLGKFPEPSKRVEVDVRLDEVVLKALEKDPSRRYQKVSELRTRMETMASDPPAEMIRSFRTKGRRRPRRARVVVWAFAACLVVFFLLRSGVEVGGWIASVVTAFGPANIGRAEFVEEMAEEHVLDRGGELILRNVNGAIDIRSWDRPEVRIEVEKRARSASELERIDLTINPDPNRIAVQVKLPRVRQGWFRRESAIRAEVLFRIFVPENIRFVHLESVNSNIALEGVRCAVRASTVNGTIRASALEADANLETVNGAIQVALAALAPDGSLTFSAVNGSVDAILPDDADATLRASTVNGRIRCDFPLPPSSELDRRNFRVTLGTGGALINASTVNGNIRIRPASPNHPDRKEMSVEGNSAAHSPIDVRPES